MDLIERREILREDGQKLDSNFKKLALGRIDALIDSNILIKYYLKTNDAYDRFVITEKVANSYKIHVRVSKQSPVSAHNFPP